MRKIFISAGHSNRAGRDRGATGNGFIEGELTVELRNLIISELNKLGVKPIVDGDNTILSETLNFFRNLTTPNCIVLDLHWNAAAPTATGTETLIPSNPSQFEINLAEALSKAVNETLGIRLRGNHKGKLGVKTEAESHHGRLGWMRLTGENVLMEICFITNSSDMNAYQKNKNTLAKKIAEVLYSFAGGVLNKVNSNRLTHTVKRGETLFSIARFYSVSVDNILKLNNLRTDVIREGQVLIIRQN
jgi:N-acetylmuramoyl-L-alanine amidase